MFVVNRKGLTEPVSFDKIAARLGKLCYGLNPLVDHMLVAQKVINGLYKGITTSELDELASETAAFMSSVHPDFADFAARVAVSNLHKNTNKDFSVVATQLYSYVDPKTNKPAPMLAEDVYAFIQAHADELNAAIVHDRDNSFDYFGFKVRNKALVLSGWLFRFCVNDERMIHRYFFFFYLILCLVLLSDFVRFVLTQGQREGCRTSTAPDNACGMWSVVW